MSRTREPNSPSRRPGDVLADVLRATLADVLARARTRIDASATAADVDGGDGSVDTTNCLGEYAIAHLSGNAHCNGAGYDTRVPVKSR